MADAAAMLENVGAITRLLMDRLGRNWVVAYPTNASTAKPFLRYWSLLLTAQ